MFEYQFKESIGVKTGEYELRIQKKGENLGKIINNLVPEGLIEYESEDLTVLEFENLRRILKNRLVSAKNIFAKQRAIKSHLEIEKIQDSVSETDHAFEVLYKTLSKQKKPISEIGLMNFIKMYALSHNLDIGFEPIVAFGKNSAQPHHVSSNQILMKHKPILIDFGLKKEGFSGDMTRVISFGNVDPRVSDIYKIVLECNELCIEKIRPDVDFGDIHQFAFKFFKKFKLSEKFIHSIGHGIGLDIHENPLVRKQKRSILKENMVLTIEPGLYFEEDFGIRIEDVVLVTKNGSRVLSKSFKNEIQVM